MRCGGGSGLDSAVMLPRIRVASSRCKIVKDQGVFCHDATQTIGGQTEPLVPSISVHILWSCCCGVRCVLKLCSGKQHGASIYDLAAWHRQLVWERFLQFFVRYVGSGCWPLDRKVCSNGPLPTRIHGNRPFSAALK